MGSDSFTVAQVAQAAGLSPKNIRTLLGEKELYSKQDLERARQVSDEMRLLNTSSMEAAIASLSQQQQQSTDPNPSVSDTESVQEGSGGDSDLAIVLNQYKLERVQQVASFQQDIEHFEEQVADAVVGIIGASDRNIRTLVTNKLAKKMQKDPLGLGAVGVALFQQFRLPEPREVAPMQATELLETKTIELLPGGNGNYGERSGQ